jgi:glycosyltransferase involved in cell wall biosynthesis
MTADVTLVIPVLDEAETIDSLLDDCQALAPAPREVIVVDAGSTDGTWARVQSRMQAWPALRLVHAPGAHPGAARDAGIEQASHPVIATLDAGSRVDATWLGAMLAVLEQSPSAAVVGVVVPDPHSPLEEATGWLTVRALKSPTSGGRLSREYLPPGRSGYCFRKQTWAEVGGYPTALWSEDKVFARRLVRGGHAILVSPSAEVRWRPRGTLRALHAQYTYYSRADAHSGIDRRNSFLPAVVGVGLVGAGISGRRGRRAVAGMLLAYLGLFVAAAWRAGLRGTALAWVIPARLAIEAGKARGLALGTADKTINRASRPAGAGDRRPQ